MGGALQEGWVIANHILVSFHVAFISSILVLPAEAVLRSEVLRFVFVSSETVVSALFVFVTFHFGIAVHEMGHFLTAARLNALNESILPGIRERLSAPGWRRFAYLANVFLRIPYGRAIGVKREGLNYYPDAPYNLAVAAAGPRASRNAALIALPPAVLAIALGLIFDAPFVINLGRLALGIGTVCLLDFLLADPGKYAAFRERERRAADKARSVAKLSGWLRLAPEVKRKMLTGRMWTSTHPRLGPVSAPWQYRNCGMGGRHTEKEYPESNISMQEAMFLILQAHDYQEAQELTVRLQNRLKEIIEKAEGCRVMGIGLEGGLAPYIEKADYPLPEVRLWAMMKQAIEEVGSQPGVDVAIALDPAMSELENAYRDEFNVPDAVGMYLFWRDKAKVVLDRDDVLSVYVKAIEDYEIPLLSIEDGFSERDFEGWALLLQRLGDRIFVIGDDLVTTNDQTIEEAAGQGLINAALIKANQIGSLFETLLAMLVALGKGLELVVSHRSKSPNDDMEAHIALAVNALGLKAGGGANTERLIKYQAVTELMLKLAETTRVYALNKGERALIERVRAYEASTNAGVPTVGATLEVALPESGVMLTFRGATPLGTSAGEGEAIHLVDALIEYAEYHEIIDRAPDLFTETESGVYRFGKGVDDERIRRASDDALTALYNRSRRYGGKGCLNAVDNVLQIIAPHIEGRDVATLTLKETDRALLGLELREARRRNKLDDDISAQTLIRTMQRKQNLGMNALLTVSLSVARAIAHIQGKELYELLREQMVAFIDRLADEYEVSVAGSRFEDYVDALREVNHKLEVSGVPLYTVLRELTGIYAESDASEGDIGLLSPILAEETQLAREQPLTEVSTPESERLTAEQEATVFVLNGDLFNAYVSGTDALSEPDALRHYRDVKSEIAHQVGNFGIVNNRIFRSADRLLVPYLLGDTLIRYLVVDGGSEPLVAEHFPAGTIFTDRLVIDTIGFEGEVIDLEQAIFVFDVENVKEIRVNRIRDIASLLKTVNGCTNRNEAVYWLRLLVARLCNLPVKTFLKAKNLQPEINNLSVELVRLINSPTSQRLPWLIRILVRNLSALMGEPNLIDRLWNDTIDLAEVHIRGSAIVNELRRSSHHALGTRTLELAHAYRTFLDTGATEELRRLGFASTAQADSEVRGRKTPREILERVVADLERLLGTSEVVTRIREWRGAYTESLMRCEFGNSIEDQLDTLLEKGVRPKNRWAYYHHLRILEQKVEDLSHPADIRTEFSKRLGAMQELQPDSDDFDANAAERGLQSLIAELVKAILEAHQLELFDSLDNALDAFERRAFFVTFSQLRRLRVWLRERTRLGGFTDQRYHLWQLDCLLEEMGYLALRHIASEYANSGVQLDQCLEIIRVSIWNLEIDGTFSRELYDLAGMLTGPAKQDDELLNVLNYIERYYHKIRQRVTVPYEMLHDRMGLSKDELRTVLANMQRYMHDLNSMVHFSDIAEAAIRDRQTTQTAPRSKPPSKTENINPFDGIQHISHRGELADLVKVRETAPSLKELYGGKASGLLYISHLKLPTRDGFVLPTSIPRAGLHKSDRTELEAQIEHHLTILEADLTRSRGTERQFGDEEQPLILAVRGGSVFSMPGILATVVFVGMNDRIAESLSQSDPWCAYDCYRRFLASYAWAVWGIDVEVFDLVEVVKRRYGATHKKDLPWEAMREIAESTKSVLTKQGFGKQLEEMLENPKRQLVEAVLAVFDSWNSTTAKRYRELKGLSDSWQSAVVVQEMAFGNRANEPVRQGMDETSASLTGVIPRTFSTKRGVREFAGEIKFSAAGDDLVAGVTALSSLRQVDELPLLLPMMEMRLKHVVAKLRRFMGTDQEVEFTVEQGVLSVLQSRTAETAADQPAARFVEPGRPAARGLGVRGSAFRGLAAFDEESRSQLSALDLSERNDVDGVLMMLENPTPDDIPIIISADGLLTAKGGSTSHAAVAVNGIEDRSFHAVMSAANLRVNTKRREAVIVDEEGEPLHRIHLGDVVSIHGTSGEVYIGSHARAQIE